MRSAAALALTLAVAPSCAGDFDARRAPPPPSTLGEDVYSALCDRLGAAVLTEDLSGASYRGICHRGAGGRYSDTVNQSPAVLPPVSGGAALARRLSVAKLEALARRRAELIRAIDFVMDDGEVPVPYSNGQTVRGHEALSEMLRHLVPLYETNPVAGTTDPMSGLLPEVTRSVGRLFRGLAGPEAGASGDETVSLVAREAMARISGRQGYRPLRVTLGAMRPALAYPGLRTLSQTLLPRAQKGGPLRDPLQNVFGMMESELATSVLALRPEPYAVDQATMQPNRPRSKMEIGRAMMHASDPAFARPGAEPRFLVLRDSRGAVVPLGNVPGTPGTVPAFLADADGDGFADVDAAGRFFGADGALAALDPPFVVPAFARFLAPDAFGRAVDASGTPAFEYLDTSQTLLAAVFADLEPLLDPDPAFQNETVADLLSGAFRLYGDPITRPAPWAVGGAYASFDARTSPIADLLHATGQLLAHPRSDSWLALLSTLMRDEEPALARFLGAALRLREISNAHPEIALDPHSLFWDEFMDVLVQMLRRGPDVLKDVLRALRHPDLVAYMPGALRLYAEHTDALSYDPNDLGAPPVNLTVGGSVDPETPVDRAQPDIGANRSELHKFLQAVHDVNGVNACNKEGARVSVVVNLPILPPLDLVWPVPPLPGYSECSLFVFENMGIVFVDAILGKVQVEIRDSLLDGLLNGPLGGLVDADQLFEESSGIPGMTLTPSAQAFARLAFFGAESTLYDPLFNGQMPDRDPFWNGKNDKTNRFVRNLVDAVSTSVCPTRPPFGNPGLPPGFVIADCALPTGNPFDVLRIRDQGTIFTWEKYQFYDGMRPLLSALDAHESADLFLELSEVIYRHFPSREPSRPGTECSAEGTWRKTLDGANPLPRCPGGSPCYNSKYCAGSGLSAYEPIIIEALATDLMPALAGLVDALERTRIVDQRQGAPVEKSGLDVAVELSEALFDPVYSGSVGIVDRSGGAATTLADEVTPKAQVTPFDLFAKAMRAIDVRLEGDPRRDRWRRARSRLVDTFLAIDGEGTSARFRNPATAKAIPILVDTLRQQLNAHCGARETSGMPCTWARVEMAANAALTFEEPAFSATMSLIDVINEDEAARRELERLLRYLVQQASDHDALQATLASMADMLQLLGDDEIMPPIYNAIATAAAPDSSTAPGAAERTVQLLTALTEEPPGAGGERSRNRYDPYRILDRILTNLVTPLDGTDPASPTALEIILDTIAEVNRVDASLPPTEPLDAKDYELVFGTLRDFMLSKTRGMEQFYEVVRSRGGG